MHHTRCDGVTRRDFVRVGGLGAFGVGALGLSLSDVLRGRARAADPAERAKSSLPVKAKNCILIWLDGGPSHLETFDLKPEAPAEVRGPLAAIDTAVPGVQICELLPRTAERLDRATLIRSMTSPLGEHNFGAHYLLSGYKPTPVVEYPVFGCVLAKVRGQEGVLPPHIAVPDFGVGGAKSSGNGYLPGEFRPFSVGSDPAKPDFSVRDLNYYPLVTEARLKRRREFLRKLDGFQRGVEEEEEKKKTTGGPPVGTGEDPQFEQAYRLITSPAAKRAFDLGEEKPDDRARYGSRTIGQSCLLARRLVERGVPFVTVNYTGWDTHDNLYTRLKEGYTGAQVPVGLVPSLDLALSALMDDLSGRGLLEETLVVVMGEFGRTPKLNTAGGRDHWPRVFSVLLAGGGTPGGVVIGESDATAEGPKDRPVTPADLACTIYTLLGIDPALELHTADGRPVRVNSGGEVLKEFIS
jgi:hypothetical protein